MIGEKIQPSLGKWPRVKMIENSVPYIAHGSLEMDRWVLRMKWHVLVETV